MHRTKTNAQLLDKTHNAMFSTTYTFTLNDTARKYCEEILNETEESRFAAFQDLKEWALANPQLHIKTEERFLLQFLRGCKFNLDRTKIKITDYFTMRRDIPQWYTHRNPALPEIQELIKLGVFVPLRKNYNNQLVIIIRTAAHNPKIHKQDDVFKAGNMILDIATRDNEEAQIYGVLAIFDMKGISWSHARVLTPAVVKKAVRSWQNYHCRPKRLDFVNAPIYINVVLNIFKGFMGEKMKSRVQVHFNGLDGLHEILPKEILPVEYGGSGDPLGEIIEYWRQKVCENSEWFMQDEEFRAD